MESFTLKWSGLNDFFWFFEMEELRAPEAKDYNWSQVLNCLIFKEIKGIFLMIKIRQIIGLYSFLKIVIFWGYEFLKLCLWQLKN